MMKYTWMPPTHILPALLALMAAPVLPAQENAPAQAGIQTESHPALATDPQLFTGTLKNGMRYIIRPTKEPAGRGSVRLYIGVGSLYETDENSGISHFLEHMVFNGSRTFKRGELIPTMQKLGLGFGGDANAYTSLLQTVYMLDLPNLEEKTVDFALTIMRDFADGATLEDEAIDHERGIVVSELKSRDSASYRAHIGILGQMTEGTRTAEFLPIGKEEIIRHAPYEVVRKYYKDHYVPERMTLIFTGDVKPETAELWIRKHFESLESRPAAPRPDKGQLKQPIQSVKLIANPEQADVSIMVTEVTPYVYKPDTLEQRVEDLPLDLAFEMLNRRLSRLAKKADCPFINAKIEQDDMVQVSEVTGISLTARPEKWQQALTLVTQQVRQAIRYGFSPDELKECAAGLMSNLQQACDTWETVPAQTMATRLVKRLSNNLALTAPEENLRAATIGLQKVMQDPDLCRRALEAAFHPEKVCLSMLGALPEGITEDAMSAAYAEALKAEITEPEQVNTKPFAYDTIGMPGSITQQKKLDDIGTTLLTLSNGIKVNLKPIDFRKGSISVTAAVDGGGMTLSHTPGLADMTRAVMSQGGLQEHSMDELERLLAAHQVTMNFGLKQTRFLFSGVTNQADFELQCKLLAAAILHPGYRADGEIQLKRRLENTYRELETTPEGAFIKQGNRALYGNDPRFNVPEREQIEALSAQSVKQALEPMLKSNAIEVSIVGDFQIEEVLPILERTFGAMPQRKSEFEEIPAEKRRVNFAPWGQRAYLRYPTELDKTIVAQVRYAGDGRDKRRNRRLTVLASIVREKLFDGLRAAMGESYSPRVNVQIKDDFDKAATITTVSAGVKGNRAKVNAAMESICNGIGQGFITQEDFDCAIRPYLSRVQKLLISPDYWEAELENLQSDPEQLQLIRDLVKDVGSITLDEIRDLGKEIFGSEDKTNFYFVVPENYQESDSAAEQEEPVSKPEQTPIKAQPAAGEYVVITSRETAAAPEWKLVADTLVQKYEGATLKVLPALTEDALIQALRESGARYAAYVLRPEEIGRELVNNIHRAARKVDDDPYGDCIWGIVTGYSAKDAQRIAEAKEPLIIRRLLATTNVNAARFEHSYCIADYDGIPIFEQSGYTEPTKTIYTADTPEGKAIVENGMQGKFAQQLSTQKPHFIVTSSHATPFNLEMPFSKGLIFPANNRFYQVGAKQLLAFTSACQPAMEGKTEALQSLAEAMQFPVIEPDATERVWIAAGNCLMGDAAHTNQSMVITAISAYGCNQFVGYTVPSWFGAAGWGTLYFFMDHADGTTLAEAFFLNNQFIIEETLRLNPKLMEVQFNDAQISPTIVRDMQNARVALRQDQVKQAMGLVHDRDTLAFYGDPAWVATVDSSHEHAALAIRWLSDTACEITAHRDFDSRAAIWFPSAAIGRNASSCDLPGAVFTNDFILIPSLKLKKGETLTIHLLP